MLLSLRMDREATCIYRPNRSHDAETALPVSVHRGIVVGRRGLAPCDQIAGKRGLSWSACVGAKCPLLNESDIIAAEPPAVANEGKPCTR